MEDKKLKLEDKNIGITDEELEPYKTFFEDAYVAIDKEKNKAMVINQLAKDLKTAGYTPTKISRAIVKKLGIASLENGKKYANRDYIMKCLGSEYKDYVHGKKKSTLEKEKQQQIQKEKRLAITPTQKPKPLDEKRIKAIDQTVKKAIEIGRNHGFDVGEPELEEPEIEIIESETENIMEIDVPPTAVKGPTIKEKTQEMQQELNVLQVELTDTQNKLVDAIENHHAEHGELIQLREDYAKLLDDYNEVIKPFMERQWIQVNTLNPETGEKVPSIIEFDIVANAITRRIKIPKDKEEKKIYFKRRISSLAEKEEHEKEWKRITKGKMSFNVKVVKPKDEDGMTASELQE